MFDRCFNWALMSRIILVISLLLTLQVVAAPQIPPLSNMTKAEFSSLKSIAKKREKMLTDILKSPPTDWPYLNALVSEASPYLLQHASEPVSWRSWSQDSLGAAENESKLIFLSIGFSTCYWCQVMKKESFNDQEIAAVLNADFISIKVDRELSPNVDAFYIRALQQVKGTAGWPVTAILTPDARLLHIDSYVEKAKLQSILSKYANIQDRNPGWLLNQANMLSKIVETNSLSKDRQNIPMPDWLWLNETVLAALDVDHGGFLEAPKFPEASLLLYLLDELQRQHTPHLSDFVRTQLNNMASRGLYDHVHGGFHRYVSDAQWTVPHYEKMLYTQALMIMVYSKAWQIFSDEVYRDVVRETLVFLMNFMKNDSGGFASALDAVYKGQEGGYYLYSKQKIMNLGKSIAPESGVSLYEKGGLYGLHVSRPYQKAFERTQLSLKETYNRSALMIDRKVITSWNALLIWAISDAHMAFGDAIFKSTAVALAEQLLDLNTKEGVLHRSSFNQILAGEAVLEDHAVLTRALISLYDITGDTQWLDGALMHFDKALQLSRIKKENGEEMVSFELRSLLANLTDGELLNPVAILFESGLLLAKRGGRFEQRDKAKFLEKKLILQVEEQPLQQLYASVVLKASKKGSYTAIQYFADGNGKVISSPQKNGTNAFKILMNPHWHVNSNKPFTSNLIATSIQADTEGFDGVHYPTSKVIKFGEDQQSISVFENQMTILTEGGKGSANLTVQACSTRDNVCLLPETMNFPLSSGDSSEWK